MKEAAAKECLRAVIPKTKTIMSISALSSSSTASAAAPSLDDRLQQMFARLDGDSDGKVTQKEFSSAMEKRFGASDTSSARPDAASIFSETDTDEDGAITFAEFKTAMAEMRSAAGQAAGGAGGPPPAGGPGGGGGAGGAEAAAAKVFDERDTDEDGEVSVDELLAWMQQQETDRASATGSTDSAEVVQAFSKALEAADADGDGSVTQEELTSVFKELEPYLRGPAPERTGYEADGTPTYGSTAGINFSDVG